MHLVETYALNCGLKIDRPYIIEKFFPLDTERFITLHPNSKYPSKCYDYWQDVVDILLPVLEKENIKILQIGVKEDIPLKGCLHSQGQANLNQTAYFLSKCMLHLGVDSFPAHVASGFDKKIVCLYSNNYAANCSPYWSRQEDIALFEPLRENVEKPSFSAEEDPKSINEFNPEDIAEAVLNLLNIKSNKNLKTLRKGAFYNHSIVELVPDCVANINSMNIESIIVRMDLEFNEEALATQLSMGKCSIITTKPIKFEILNQFKENIKEFVYFIEEGHDPEFISEVVKTGFPVILMSEMEDKKIEEAKIDYMDIGVIQSPPTALEEDIQEIKNQKDKNLFYKSKRVLISKGKTYKSEAAWKKGLHSDPNDPSPLPIVDSPEFWEALDEYYILAKKT